MKSYLNRHRQIVTTTGTGASIVLAATSDGDSFFTMSEAGANDGDTFDYILLDGASVEIQRDQTWTAATRTFSRAASAQSRIAGVAGTSQINLSGTARIRVFESAQDIKKTLRSSNNLADVASASIALTSLGATTIGKALFTAATAAAARTTLNVPVIGTTVTNTVSFSLFAAGAFDVLYNLSSSTALNVNLDSAANYGDGFRCFLRNVGTAPWTLSPSVGTVNGKTSWTVLPGASLMLRSTGSNLFTIGDNAAVTIVRVQKFSASSTYTPDPNLLFAVMEATGGGGGGGGANGGAGGTSDAGGGGGSGAYSYKIALPSDIGASLAVTIGAGGSAGTGAANGSTGGATSVGSIVSASGGGGGNFGSVASGGAGGPGAAAPATGAGDVIASGVAGGNGLYANVLILQAGGSGGASQLGGGGNGGSPGGAASNGSAGSKGGGGGGGYGSNGAGLANGGAGGAGYVVITEYCSK